MQSSAPIKMLPVIHLYASFTCISKYMKIGIFSVDLFADVRFYFYLLDKQQLNVSSVHLTVTYPICLLKKHGRGLGNKWTQIYASMHKPNRCRYIYIYIFECTHNQMHSSLSIEKILHFWFCQI